MKSEPVLTAASISAAIVAILSVFHIGVDPGAVEAIIAAVLPLVLAVFVRAKVSPTEE